MNDANPCRGEHVRTKSDAAARARKAGDGTRGNDRISSLLCRPAKIKLPDRTLKITHFLRQGQMIRTIRIRVKLLHFGRAKKDRRQNDGAAGHLQRASSFRRCTRHASSAENGGWARRTSATSPTGTRPIATEVRPCPIAWETTPSNTTIVQPSALWGSRISPRATAAMASATADTAADQSVAVGPSSPTRTRLMTRR